MIIFLIDVFFSFFTAYYSKGLLIINKIRVIKHYFNSMFLWDFLSLFPFFLSEYLEIEEIKMAFLFRYIKMKKITYKLEEYLHLSDKPKGFYEILKLCSIIVYIGHFFACFWIYLANMEGFFGIENTWINSFHLSNELWYTKYVSSLYFTVYTMVTVGYGDITPTNLIERSFCVGLMIITCGVFAYSLNRFGEILQEMNKRDKELKDMIYDFTHYMKLRKVDVGLQMKMRRFLEYMHFEKTYGYNRGDELIHRLPLKLKDELKENIYYKWILNIPVFKNNFSTEFLKNLSHHFEEKTYSPENIIYEKGDRDNFDIYYITKGKVECYLCNNNSSIFELSEGKHFGEFSFFSDEKREVSIRCNQTTHVAFINKEKFLDLIKDYQNDYEKYCLIKDSVKNYQEIKFFEKNCISCDRNDHFINKCYLINFKRPQISPLQEKNKNRIFQERDKYKRKIKKAHNARFSIKLIHEKMKKINENEMNDDQNDHFNSYAENMDDERFTEFNKDNSIEIIDFNDGKDGESFIDHNVRRKTKHNTLHIHRNLKKQNFSLNLSNKDEESQNKSNDLNNECEEDISKINTNNKKISAISEQLKFKNKAKTLYPSKTLLITESDDNFMIESEDFNNHKKRKKMDTSIIRHENSEMKQSLFNEIKFLMSFDKMKIFNVYFPKDNADQFIRKLKNNSQGTDIKKAVVGFNVKRKQVYHRRKINHFTKKGMN